MWTLFALAYAIGGLVCCQFGPAAEGIPLPEDGSGTTLQRGVYYLVRYTLLFSFWPLAHAAARWPAPTGSDAGELQSPLGLMEAMSTADGEMNGAEFASGTGEFGYTAENSIPCRSISAAYDYLQRLRTRSGRAVMAMSIGSTDSNVSSNPIEMFKVRAPGGVKVTLFVSPYQNQTSKRSPQGFCLAPGREAGCVQMQLRGTK